jgi:hypothetical protein
VKYQQHKKGHKKKRISPERVATLAWKKEVDQIKDNNIRRPKRNMTILKDLHPKG